MRGFLFTTLPMPAKWLTHDLFNGLIEMVCTIADNANKDRLAKYYQNITGDSTGSHAVDYFQKSIQTAFMTRSVDFSICEKRHG